MPFELFLGLLGFVAEVWRFGTPDLRQSMQLALCLAAIRILRGIGVSVKFGELWVAGREGWCRGVHCLLEVYVLFDLRQVFARLSFFKVMQLRTDLSHPVLALFFQQFLLI